MHNIPEKRIGQTEFIALTGILFATIAFSIDSMLPAMSLIVAELTPDTPNRAQLIITSFVFGMGVGTLFTGPLSDTFGRKRVILGGAIIYVAGAILAYFANSLELVLAARLLQGLGAAGPRVAALAIVRDLYSGRDMARIMSFAMIVFTLIPAIAPLAGAGIIHLIGWRGIFLAFIVFALASNLWLGLRQPETLPPEKRRPFNATAIFSGVIEVFAIPRVVKVILVLSLTFAMLFAMISTIQQVFDQSFDRADEFPYWFGGVALVSGLASVLNAKIVVRLGMRRVIILTLISQIGFSGALVLGIVTGAFGALLLFPAYLVWMISVFFVAGLTIGNLNALGMEPLGHMAGLGTSIIGAVSTVLAVVIAIPIGMAFDGTPLPLAIGVLACSAIAWAITRMIEDVAETA